MNADDAIGQVKQPQPDQAEDFHKQDLTDRYVWIRPGVLDPGYHDPVWRVFHAGGGFGCKSFTTGTAVFGHFVADGEQCRMERPQFGRFATDDEVEAARRHRAATR